MRLKRCLVFVATIDWISESVGCGCRDLSVRFESCNRISVLTPILLSSCRSSLSVETGTEPKLIMAHSCFLQCLILCQSRLHELLLLLSSFLLSSVTQHTSQHTTTTLKTLFNFKLAYHITQPNIPSSPQFQSLLLSTMSQ